MFKYLVRHEETVNGIVYRTLNESDIERTLDFYFDVFVKGLCSILWAFCFGHFLNYLSSLCCLHL